MCVALSHNYAVIVICTICTEMHLIVKRLLQSYTWWPKRDPGFPFVMSLVDIPVFSLAVKFKIEQC